VSRCQRCTDALRKECQKSTSTRTQQGTLTGLESNGNRFAGFLSCFPFHSFTVYPFTVFFLCVWISHINSPLTPLGSTKSCSLILFHLLDVEGQTGEESWTRSLFASSKGKKHEKYQDSLTPSATRGGPTCHESKVVNPYPLLQVACGYLLTVLMLRSSCTKNMAWPHHTGWGKLNKYNNYKTCQLISWL